MSATTGSDVSCSMRSLCMASDDVIASSLSTSINSTSSSPSSRFLSWTHPPPVQKYLFTVRPVDRRIVPKPSIPLVGCVDACPAPP
eukprot:44817-Eustigmatos_ZCMA.PRE.1